MPRWLSKNEASAGALLLHGLHQAVDRAGCMQKCFCSAVFVCGIAALPFLSGAAATVTFI